MRAAKMLGVALLLFALTMAEPVSQAQALFVEDGFDSFREQGALPINPGPAVLPAMAVAFQRRSNAPALTHKVAPGVTMRSLTHCYRVERTRLMSANKIGDSARLRVGRVLTISGVSAQAGVQKKPKARRAVARGWNGSLDWPVLGELTQQFGPQAGGAFHHGLDIADNAGTPIRAAQRGLVISSGWLPVYGYVVIIDHGSGFRTLYAHLHDFAVRAGDLVRQGQVIAHVGSTGNATGPHLHFEVRHGNRSVNPMPYLKE
jgi:murein DD-endopeptidase MepM/ murein hydrolase activator NlpD